MTEINPQIKVRLVRLSEPMAWVVYGIADEEWRTVWFDLARMHDHAAASMRVLLSKTVPRNGPPVFNKKRCRPIKGTPLFEFRFEPSPGPRLRVLWFYDEGAPRFRQRIICTESFKKRDKSDQEAIERGVKNRADYIAAKAAGNLDYLGEYSDAQG